MEAAFDRAEWIDASDLLREARAVKSAREQVYVRETVAIPNRAFPDVIRELRAGLTERQVTGRLRATVLASGADQVGYTNVVADTLPTA